MRKRQFRFIANIINSAPQAGTVEEMVAARRQLAEHFAVVLNDTFGHDNFDEREAAYFVALATTRKLPWQEGYPQEPTREEVG
jgi:hypothetical protein